MNCLTVCGVMRLAMVGRHGIGRSVEGQRRVYATRRRAEEKSWPLLVPSGAVFMANRELRALEAAWDFMAFMPNAVVPEFGWLGLAVRPGSW